MDKNKPHNRICWHEKDLDVLEKVKHSIAGNKKTPHIGASGQCFWFGTNALDKIDDNNLSIDWYGNKNCKYDGHNKQIEINLSWLEGKLRASLE